MGSCAAPHTPVKAGYLTTLGLTVPYRLCFELKTTGKYSDQVCATEFSKTNPRDIETTGDREEYGRVISSRGELRNSECALRRGGEI